MKLKITQSLESKHTGVVTDIAWNNSDELFSCSDDHLILKWNLITGETLTIITLPENFFPTNLQLYPKLISSNSNKQSQENLLLTTADGRFHIINQNGRIEKSVNAHQGACLVGHWSSDGSGFLTAGEDGILRVWSRSGLARSVIANVNVPIYSAVWGPNGTSLLHSQYNKIVITYLQRNTRAIQWKAHENLILAVSWNHTNNLILSGSEDGVYRTWDIFGQLLSSSMKHDNHIKCVNWSPNGELFSVAGYNFLRMCDCSGWSHCLERPNSGTIENIAWSADGTQLAAACSNGHILIGHIIQKQVDWNNFSCSIISRKIVAVTNINDNTTEQLDFPNRITQMALGYGYLIIITTKQCYIQSSISWNTPLIFDLKDGIVYMVLMSERCFCLVERSGINIYSFMGRHLASPKWASMRLETLSKTSIALSPDILTVIDQNDSKLIHIFELQTGISVRSDHLTSNISHSMSIIYICLNQTGPSSQRQLALIDFNKDLYIISLKDIKLKFHKLAVQVKCALWCEETSVLVGLLESRIVIFGSPRTPEYFSLTTIYKDVSDLGKNSTLLKVSEGHVVIRKNDGSLLHISISSFPMLLAKRVAANQWSLALKLCRTIKDETLWACLAALAWEHKELEIAEEAFAIIKQPHQVEYIHQLRNPNLSEKSETALL